MKKRSWLIILAGALALFSIGTASAQQTPVLKLGRGDAELTGGSADIWRTRVVAGITGLGLSLRKQVALVSDQGLRVVAIEEGSTAEDAQMAVGDVITAVNGTPVSGMRAEALPELMGGADGQKTMFVVLRAGTCLNVAVVHDLDGMLGMTYEPVAPVLYPLIEYVSDDSPAGRAGLKSGDRVVEINDKPMANVMPPAGFGDWDAPLGSKIEMRVEHDGQLRTVELTESILPGWDRVIHFRMGPGFGSSAMQQYATMTIRHLDWQGGGAQSVLDWAFSDTTYNQAAGIVLDLRGTSGSNTESAARLAARFLDSGAVLRFYDEVTATDVTYTVEAGKLFKTTAYTKVLVADVGHYSGKLAVLVDGETDDVAVALARTLQQAKRAIIVGTATGHNGTLRTFIDGRDSDGNPLAILRTTGHVTNLDATALAAVTPDESAVSDPYKVALMVMDGTSPWLDPDSLAWIFCIGGSILFVLWLGVSALVNRRSGVTPVPTAAEATAPKADEPAPVADEEHADDAALQESPTPEAPEGLFSKWSVPIMLVLLIGLLFGGPPLMSHFMFGPPIGGHDEVVAELFVDGSDASQREKTLVNSLQRELQGPVKFVTIDLREHPEYASENGPKKPFAVAGAPYIWIYLVTYDRNGHEVNRSGSGAGGVYGLTKKEILKQIRWYSEGHNNEPVLPITRTYPAAK